MNFLMKNACMPMTNKDSRAASNKNGINNVIGIQF
jgi:hypothetical protein